MGILSNIVKKIVFWTYPRTSWQWDVLCVLILVFIFLTPKSWFENTEFRRSHAVKTVPLAAEVLGTARDTSEIERRVRAVTGRADAVVTAIRERRDDTGKVIGYEVDIR
jgi:hypothetical protein